MQNEIDAKTDDTKAKKSKTLGMRFERRFCPLPGRAFDQVVWEKRTAEIVNHETGAVVYRGEDLEFPKTWSQNATALVAEKYFRHVEQEHTNGVSKINLRRETSVREMIDRVASTIATWGLDAGYFGEDHETAAIFYDELCSILLHQKAAFNSPVWFNIGTKSGRLREEQGSACFINSIEDNILSILKLAETEGKLYKGGSGSGVNYSTLRSSRESLSGGGCASGPVPFIAKDDSNAGAVKSGGTCLAPYQRVYTAEGPVAVEELAKRSSFVALSYDPPAGRYKAKNAQAWHAGHKRVVKVVTDKGEFHVTGDHPVKLSSSFYVKAGELKPGMSLFACSIDNHAGYVRVHLRDGRKGKERLHRLVAHDVGGQDLEGVIVHHKDHNKLNNSLSNLEVMSQSEHARQHNEELIKAGEHVFQTSLFDTSGERNGMHRDGSFWQDEEKVEAYCALKAEEIQPRAREMQDAAAQQKMLNTAFKILNEGHSIDSFDEYVAGRKEIIGRISSIKALRQKIDSRFGSYSAFVAEVAANNHRVVAVEEVGMMDVYDVEVECPTADDKSPTTGHNFVIWDGNEHFGSGVVVANTRRAAKMALLDVDHGDILEFIRAKAESEKAAQVLIQAGFDSDFRARWGAYGLIPFQNANHSVRVTDDFMLAVQNDDDWNLLARDGKTVLETLSARKIWKEICEAAHICGDPGLQFDTTINYWHTSPKSGRIEASNPCAEYVYLNDTACNLASINLMKFQREDGTLHIEDFTHTVDVLITAMEILVDSAAYPTQTIEQNSSRYRPLGLGYTNLGAFFMTQGLAYDSDEARTQASYISSLMTARAYRQSAALAKLKGPFEGFEMNRAAMLRVITSHQRSGILSNPPKGCEELYTASQDVWESAIELGKRHGYRNAQATLLAPTGTISFLMDCDTTGIEPELSLVKTKKLVGGGTIQMVNQRVGQALQCLGYSAAQIEEIETYVFENGSVVGSTVEECHFPVFDSSFPDPVRGRFLRPEAHILMMAAVQPFVSGAISKTCNIPNDATVEDIDKLYKLSWSKGLKCVALYRDGSKGAQPLQSSFDKKESVETKLVRQRNKLPRDCPSVRHKFEIGVHEGYLHVGLYDDGSPGEIFVKMAKEGSTVSGLMDSWGIMTSMSLQYGVPLAKICEKFEHTCFEPSGWTHSKEVGHATSILDYVARWLRARFLNNENEAPAMVSTTVTRTFETPATAVSGSLLNTGITCPVCGHMTQRAGSCSACATCGWTQGCG